MSITEHHTQMVIQDIKLAVEERLVFFISHDKHREKMKEIDEKLVKQNKKWDRIIYEENFIPLDFSEYIWYMDPDRPELIFEQDDNLLPG